MPQPSKKGRRLLSVIVPAYRQERTIVKDLTSIKTALDNLKQPYELICVVDGRVDGTFQKAKKFSANFPNVKVVGYKNNKGKGHAVRHGMARSKGEVVAFIDSGMDLNHNGLAMALNHFDWYDADIIVGSKRHPASKVAYPWQRRLISLGGQIVVRVLFGLNVKDTQVGLKIFRREVLEKTLPRLLVKAFAFDIEMLAVAHYLGFKRIYECPVEVKLNFGSGSSVVSRGFIRTAFLTLWDTLAVFYRLYGMKYYSDQNHRKWRLDPDLNFRVNVG